MHTMTDDVSPMDHLWSSETRGEKWWAVYTAIFRAMRDAGRLPPNDLALFDGLMFETADVPEKHFHEACMARVVALLSHRQDLHDLVRPLLAKDAVLEVVNVLLLWEAIRLLQSDLNAFREAKDALNLVVRDPLLVCLPFGERAIGDEALRYLGLTPIAVPMRSLQSLRRTVVALTFANLANDLQSARPGLDVAELRESAKAAETEDAEGDYRFYVGLFCAATRTFEN